MKRFLIFLIGIALFAIPCHADGPVRIDQDQAKFEVLRRGNHVEQTGTYRSGLMASALSPPADDSSKWFLTLVYQPGEKGSESMRAMIANSPDMRPWVNVADPGVSMMHYQERSFNATTQADWLANIRQEIVQKGLPVLVLQPSRNGKFGENTRIVKLLHGVRTGKETSDALRAAIMTYVQSIEEPRSIGVAPPFDAVAVSPPFAVQPAVAPQPPAVAPNAVTPWDWPPSAPTALTIDQVMTACPGATPEFVRSVVTSKTTDLGLVRLDWMIYQKEHPPQSATPARDVPEDCPVPVNPSKPEPHSPAWILAVVMLGAFVVGWLMKMATTYVAAKVDTIRAYAREIETMKRNQSDQGLKVRAQMAEHLNP